jgi:hypothetical protein
MKYKEAHRFAIGNTVQPRKDVLVITGSEATHQFCVLLGIDLKPEEPKEVVIGQGENCLRIKANGDLYLKGEKIKGLTDSVVKEFNTLLRRNIEIIEKRIKDENR